MIKSGVYCFKLFSQVSDVAHGPLVHCMFDIYLIHNIAYNNVCVSKKTNFFFQEILLAQRKTPQWVQLSITYGNYNVVGEIRQMNAALFDHFQNVEMDLKYSKHCTL